MQTEQIKAMTALDIGKIFCLPLFVTAWMGSSECTNSLKTNRHGIYETVYHMISEFLTAFKQGLILNSAGQHGRKDTGNKLWTFCNITTESGREAAIPIAIPTPEYKRCPSM